MNISWLGLKVFCRKFVLWSVYETLILNNGKFCFSLKLSWIKIQFISKLNLFSGIGKWTQHFDGSRFFSRIFNSTKTNRIEFHDMSISFIFKFEKNPLMWLKFRVNIKIWFVVILFGLKILSNFLWWFFFVKT